VIVPLGGGGLISGTAIAVKSLRPEVRVIGVQAAVCAPYAGGAAAAGPVVTLADGIAVKYPGELTGPLVDQWVDEVVTVDEDAIADAMVLLMDRAKLYVEGAGAVGVAALLSGSVNPAARGSTCVVLSGGNVDLGVVPSLIRRHENRAGRRLSVVARIDDRPGSLAHLLAVFADGGADLIEVQHVREGLELHVRETGIHATFAVRSGDQARALIASARRGGLRDQSEQLVTTRSRPRPPRVTLSPWTNSGWSVGSCSAPCSSSTGSDTSSTSRARPDTRQPRASVPPDPAQWPRGSRSSSAAPRCCSGSGATSVRCC
jgi:hypothetical protein